jgi:hypothetical protein
MDALKVLAIGLVILGLIFSMSNSPSKADGPKGNMIYASQTGPLGDGHYEGIAGGFQPYKDKLKNFRLDEQ